MGWFSKLLTGVADIFGMGGGKDLGKAYEEQLRQQQEAAKLNANIEQGNVTQFQDVTTNTDFAATDQRRKKQSTGAYASALGLQV